MLRQPKPLNAIWIFSVLFMKFSFFVKSVAGCKSRCVRVCVCWRPRKRKTLSRPHNIRNNTFYVVHMRRAVMCAINNNKNRIDQARKSNSFFLWFVGKRSICSILLFFSIVNVMKLLVYTKIDSWLSLSGMWMFLVVIVVVLRKSNFSRCVFTFCTWFFLVFSTENCRSFMK